MATLILRDSSGNVIMDASTRLATNITTVSVGTTNGSYTVTNIGTPAFIVIPSGYYNEQPAFTISGQTISWTWRTSGGAFNQPCTLFVAVH